MQSVHIGTGSDDNLDLSLRPAAADSSVFLNIIPVGTLQRDFTVPGIMFVIVGYDSGTDAVSSDRKRKNLRQWKR